LKDSTNLLVETEEKMMKAKFKENINAINERCNDYAILCLKQNKKTDVGIENENTNFYEKDLHR
jgi:hypothetical protein